MIPEVTTQNKASSVVLWSNLSRAIFVCIEFLNLAVFFGDYNCYIMVCYGMLVSGLFKEEKKFFSGTKNGSPLAIDSILVLGFGSIFCS